MNSSENTTRSALSAAAAARARRAFSALPATSPTMGLSCAIAIASRSGGRLFMQACVAPAPRTGNPAARGCLRSQGPDPGRAGLELDRASLLERLAVEVEDLKLVLDHALQEQHLAVLAPSRALAPVTDLGFGDRRELGPVDREDLEQSVVVEERRAFWTVGAVHHGDGDEFSVRRHGDSLRRLADRNGVDDARRLGREVDDIDHVGVALPAALVAEHRNVALRADLEAVGADAADHVAL